MPLALMPGYNERISEIAAIAIAITAVVVGSMRFVESYWSVAVLEKSASTRNGFYRYRLGSYLWVWTITSRMANT